MYLAVAGACAAGNTSTPLAASIPAEGFTDVVIKEVEGGGAFTTSQGEFQVSVSPSGGSGSYTFSWSITEDADPTSSFSVVSTGTTATQTYNTATFSGVAGDPPNQADYTVTCTVSDGSSTAQASRRFSVIGIAI